MKFLFQTETCTQKLQAKIMNIKNYKSVFISLLLLKQVFFLIVIANYIRQICKNKQQVYGPAENSEERNRIPVSSQYSGLPAESGSIKLEQMVDEESGRDAEIMRLVQVDDGNGDLAAVTQNNDFAELPE
jgi:hypothetical protein